MQVIYKVCYAMGMDFKCDNVIIGEKESGNKSIVAINTIIEMCNAEGKQITKIVSSIRNKHAEMLIKLKEMSTK